MKALGPLALLCGVCAPAQIALWNAAGVSMGRLYIVTPHPEQHTRLWIDVLGGKRLKFGTLEGAMFPGAFVGISKGESSGGTDGSVIDHLGFAVRDLAGTKSKLTAAGVAIVRELPATKQFFANFPDDIKVEFTEIADLDVPIKHHHIHFATDQVDAMRAWYAKHFDAVPGMRGRFKAADIPGANLSWNPSDTPKLPTKRRALDHIVFEIRDLVAFCKKLEAADVKLDTQPADRHAFLTDPWGTRIELTQSLQ